MRTKEGNKEKDIIEAAVEVFAREGYHNARITTIADAAGCSTGSVYLYYESKEDLLLEIFRRLWQELTTTTAEFVRRTDIGPVAKFEGMLDLFFDLFASNRPLAIVFVNEQNHLVQRGTGDFNPLYERYLALAGEVLAEGRRAGAFNDTIDLKVLLQFAFGGIRNLIHQWASDPERLPLNTIRRNVKAIFKQGILAPAPTAGTGKKSR